MKFNDLQKGKIYTTKDGVSAFRFECLYNEQLAEFLECEYDEEKGEYMATNTTRLFNKFEIMDLI